MATETLYADAHLAGSFPNPNNAVGNTPTTWAGDLNVNSSYTSRWSIANTVDPLTSAATHTVNVLARKGSNSGNPTIAINLYDNGTLVGTILAATNVTSTTGQTLTATFNTSQVSNAANVEIEVVQTSAGGSPSARNSAQVAYIEVVFDTTAASVDRRARLSFTETELPNAPRRARMSFTELEFAEAPRRARISFTETEIPNGARAAQISFTELETTDPPRRGRVSFAEFEAGATDRAGRISFTELEITSAPRRARISFAEAEVPTAPRRARLSWAEMETGTSTRRAQISFVVFDVPSPAGVGGRPSRRIMVIGIG